jgi:hypothetical protein
MELKTGKLIINSHTPRISLDPFWNCQDLVDSTLPWKVSPVIIPEQVRLLYVQCFKKLDNTGCRVFKSDSGKIRGILVHPRLNAGADLGCRNPTYTD